MFSQMTSEGGGASSTFRRYFLPLCSKRIGWGWLYIPPTLFLSPGFVCGINSTATFAFDGDGAAGHSFPILFLGHLG